MSLWMRALVVLLLFSPGLVLGQQEPTPLGSRITVQSQLVLVPTEVRTKKGDTIFGLNADDFVIAVDGVPQQVRLDTSGDPVPLSLVVLVQCSRTAWREGPKVRGLATMVDAIVGAAPAEVAVVDFGKDLELLSSLTSDPAQRDAAFNKLQPCDDDPGDAIVDAVAYADKLLERHHAPGRRAILLVSETRDHGSAQKPESVVEALGRSNTVVESVAFSPFRDEQVESLKTGAPSSVLQPMSLLYTVLQAFRKNVPKELARLSGGEYINFSNEKGFDRSLNTLANRIHNGYQLSFRPHFPPDSEASAPGLHSVTVRVPKYPDAVVEHRASYWAEPPAP